MYVYVKSEPGLFTVGFFDPNGKWHSDSDHTDREEAAKRVAYLNGSEQESAHMQNPKSLRVLFALIVLPWLAIGAALAHFATDKACDSDACRYDSTITIYPDSHNSSGGYIDACGELPGLVGDDC